MLVTRGLMGDRDLHRLLATWLAWLLVLCVFQAIVGARLQPDRPDAVLGWTPGETGRAVLRCRPLLADPTFNEHVAFDSEYFLSIAITGYGDPNAQAYKPGPGGVAFSGVPSCSPNVPDGWISLDDAFLPGYPMAMRPVMAVLAVLPGTSGLSDIGRATLAGILVAALGGLLAMLALARLWAVLEARSGAARRPGAAESASGPWGGSGGLRAATYLLVFPTGFYLAQVYSEGLFLGLAFVACALAVERRLLPAAMFAGLAVAVRPAGVFLALPLAWAAFEGLREWRAAGDRQPASWRIALPWLAPVVPVAAFGAWYASDLGVRWRAVEDGYFGRTFDLEASWRMWVATWDSLTTGVDGTAAVGGYAVFGGGPLAPASAVYIGLELAALALGVAATIWLARRMPGVALFGAGVLVLAFGSSGGGEQGMVRYVLAVPSIFLLLATLGRAAVVDRAWLLASTLLMGMLAMLFTFGFWVA